MLRPRWRSNKLARAGVHAIVAALALAIAQAARFQGRVIVRGDFQVIARYTLDATTGGRKGKGDGGLVEGSIRVPHDSVLVFYDDASDSYPRLEQNRRARCAQATQTTGNGYARAVQHLQGGGVPNDIRQTLEAKDRPSVWRIAVARCLPHLHRSLLQELRAVGWAVSPEHGRLLYRSSRYDKYSGRAMSHPLHHHLGHALPAAERVGYVHVDLHIVSLSRPSGWTSEFPADEVDLLPLTLFFTGCFVCLGSALALDGHCWRRARRAAQGERFNASMLPFYIVAAILCAETVALALSTLELISFAATGVERIDSVSFLRLLSLMFDEMVRIATVSTLVLAGNGWMIISPKLREVDSLAGAMWMLNMFYVLATLVALVYRTSPNFTNEYNGFVWIFILVVETGILAYALVCAIVIYYTSESLQSQGTRRTEALMQTRARARCMRVVMACIALFVLQNFLGGILSAVAPAWGRVDSIFVVTVICQVLVSAGLSYVYRPSQLALLHSTRFAASRRTDHRKELQADADPWVKGAADETLDDEESAFLLQ